MTTPTVHPEHRMLIDGKLVEADSGATFPNINPATEEEIGRVSDASGPEVHRAIAAARRAFDETDWSTNRSLRKRCLEQLQVALEAEREDLREQLILEAGCPRMTTYGGQLDATLEEALHHPIKLIDEFHWEIEMPDRPGVDGRPNQRRIWREPIGVVGAIVPWNYPLRITLNKIGQALATGNTVVLKPAPDTPWNATFLGRLIAERTDFPAGAVNVVPTSDNLVAEELTLSPQVDMISFTGSTAVGKRIAEKGAATMKRTFLELGGKSATIVLDDADFDTALKSTLAAVCAHAGQACAIPTRLLLPRSRYDEGVATLTELFATVPYGDPQRPDHTMGPLISARQRDRVLDYIEQGTAQGAILAFGGGRPADLPIGWYVEPTLLVDVDNSMTVAQEEIFGPVLCVIAYDDDEDAVRIANDSVYGLSGKVYGSPERSLDVAGRIRCGMMSVNGGAAHGIDMPFGGYKHSGIGRQDGLDGFEQHVEVKSIAWPV